MVVHRQCHVPQREAGHSAGALAQMQPGGEKRGLAQCIQHQTGGRLRGTVTGKHRFGRGRAQPHGAQGRHAADEAVHYHGHAFQRTAQKDA